MAEIIIAIMSVSVEVKIIYKPAFIKVRGLFSIAVHAYYICCSVQFIHSYILLILSSVFIKE